MVREMTPVEYRQCLKALGFTQVALSRLLGTSERASGYYARGEHRVPAPLAAMLRLMVKTGTSAAELEAL